MAEYINLDDMLEQFDKCASKLVGDGRVSIEVMHDFICNRPKANVKEIIYAHWIMHEDYLGLTCECSNCHIETMGDSEYCPHCGAEMSEVIK